MTTTNTTYNLPTSYTSKSITYKEIEELNGFLIYSCSGLGRTPWFEIYKPIFVPYFKIAGKDVSAHYRLHKDEDFGKYAWTFDTLEQAHEKARKEGLETIGEVLDI